MVTTVYDWVIVSIYDRYNSHDENTFVGKVLFGYVLDDQTCRYAIHDYVTTSRIEKSDLSRGIIETHSRSTYILQGKGTENCIEFKDFELLRMGYSPQQISKFNDANISVLH